MMMNHESEREKNRQLGRGDDRVKRTIDAPTTTTRQPKACDECFHNHAIGNDTHIRNNTTMLVK